MAQPDVVSAGPRGTAVVDEAVPQQQFRQPVPGPHQVTTTVLPGPDKITRRFLVDGRDRHRRDLVRPQQTGQMERVAWRRS